jgi:ribosomal protein L29
MKSNQLKELHTKTVDELTRDLRDLKAEIIKQENEWVHGKVKNTNLIRGIRKDVARVMTVMHMKKMAPVVEKVEEEVKKEKKVKKEAAAV